mgnify:CR=1 FL=1
MTPDPYQHLVTSLRALADLAAAKTAFIAKKTAKETADATKATCGQDFTNAQADLDAKVQGGALEGSNVSPVETMVAMIAAGRQFEQQMKLLQIAQTQGQQSAKLLGST